MHSQMWGLKPHKTWCRSIGAHCRTACNRKARAWPAVHIERRAVGQGTESCMRWSFSANDIHVYASICGDVNQLRKSLGGECPPANSTTPRVVSTKALSMEHLQLLPGRAQQMDQDLRIRAAPSNDLSHFVVQLLFLFHLGIVAVAYSH